MRYAQEQLPQVVESVKTEIIKLGLDPDQFEIEIRDSDRSVRVAVYTDNGGCMVRLFAPHDMPRLINEIKELFKING